MVIACYCLYEISFFNNVQIFFLLPFRLSPKGLSPSPLSRPKSALWESKADVALTSVFRSLRTKNSQCFMISMPKTASKYHITHQPCVSRSNRVTSQPAPSPAVSSFHRQKSPNSYVIILRHFHGS